ncbi:MAG TPA: hypothetical protein VMT82_11330 [candidate division Zixibacteria bacterium]|nr:hypothetical protein [candidate division Zixibacteria bacterium]
MNMSQAQLVLTIAGLLMQAALVGVLIWRRAYHSHLTFFAYVCYTFSLDVVLFAIRDHASAYLYTYYVGTLLQQGLMFAVGVEVFLGSFRAFQNIPKRQVAALAAATCWAIGTIAVATYAVGTSYTNGFVIVARSMDRAVTFSLFATFLFLALFSSYLQLPWHRRTHGIGLGFLFSLPVTTVVAWLYSLNVGMVNDKMWIIGAATFFITESIWMISFIAPERTRYLGTLTDVLSLQHEIRDGQITVELVNPEVAESDADAPRYWLAKKPQASPKV